MSEIARDSSFAETADNSDPPSDCESEFMESDEDDFFYDSADDYDLEESLGPLPTEQDNVGSKSEPLMPENVTDQTEAMEHFRRVFRKRYGNSIPEFYLGNIDGLVRSSLLCKAKERKMVSMYLHSDRSVISNIFCTQVLCDESVVSYLNSNFVNYAWDLTTEANRTSLVEQLKRKFGDAIASKVRSWSENPSWLPVLLLLSRSGTKYEIVKVINGSSDVNEVMMHLIESQDIFTEMQGSDIRIETEREERTRIQNEQDKAYQESLAADQAKAKKRRAEKEEEERVQKEAERRQREEKEIQEKEALKKAAIKSAAMEKLAEEPPSGCSLQLTTIRFRTPEGVLFTRRFYAHQQLSELINYVASEGFHGFKILTTYPRKDLALADSERSLMELQLYPQETLRLEEQ